MLSPAELTSMQATILASLTDEADILRETRTPRPSGGYDLTYPKHNSDPIPCLRAPTGVPQELLIAGQEVGFMPEIIVFAAGTDIIGSDRIVVAGVTYHVIDPFGPFSNEIERRVLVRRGSLVG
jgi:hypothetical protein